MKNSIILNLKEGYTPDNLFPKTVLESTHPQLNIKRVYNLSSNSELKNSLELLPHSDKAEAEKIITRSMDESEKKLYRTYEIEIPEGTNAEKLIKELNELPGVNYVQSNLMNDLYVIPDDPYLKAMYALHKIECTKAWDYSSGEEIIVAVIDTGVDYNHPDLKNNMWKDSNGKHGFNFSEENDNPADYHSHGTHVAGTIAASGNNSMGIIGVAYKAKIMAIKIFPNAYDTVCAKAIKYAVDNGARVINNSWGPTMRHPSNPILEEAIDYAVSKGVAVIFAAGNNADDVSYYSPANYSKVVSVAATDENDNIADFSNFGANILVSAPGKEILSLNFNTSNYCSKSGTSMAAPHVTGLAALIISQNKGISITELKEKISDNVDLINSPIHKPIGKGRINAFKSVKQ